MSKPASQTVPACNSTAVHGPAGRHDLLATAEYFISIGCPRNAVGDLLDAQERVEELLLAAVRAMRGQDVSWVQVGLELDVSARSAHQRYAHQITGGDHA